MATDAELEALVAAAYRGKSAGAPEGSFASRVETGDPYASLVKARYAEPPESLGEALQQDVSGIAALDPTNPRNLPGIARHVLPMAIQMAMVGRLGPGAGVLKKILASGGSSVAGGLAQQGIDAASGKPAEVSAGRMLLDFLLGAGGETAALSGGAAIRSVTGKSGMLREGEQASREATEAILAKQADAGRTAELGALKGQEQYDIARTGAMLTQDAKRADVGMLAEQKALKAQEALRTKVMSRQDQIAKLGLQNSDNALGAAREDILERQVRDFLGGPSPLDNPTIETLSPRVAPVRESVHRNFRGIMGGLSGKFDALLEPHRALPITGDFVNAVDTEKTILQNNDLTVSKSFSSLMDKVAELGGSAARGVADLPRVPAGTLTQAEIGQRVRMALRDRAGQAPSSGPTVQQADEIRRKLTKVVIGDGSPVERRVANRLINTIDVSLGKVLPENVQADLTNRRREWHEANNVFSSKFRSTLFKAETPADVANVLYGASKGTKAHRALAIINATPPDEKPLLRSAFAERLSQGDVAKNVAGLDPRVWKQLFGGSATPEEFIEGSRRSIVEKFDLERVMSDPAQAARFNARLQDGFNSVGMKQARQGLARAEAQLKATKDPGKALQDAMRAEPTSEQAAEVAMAGKVRPDVASARQAAETAVAADMEQPAVAGLRGEMAGMRDPLIGRKMQSFVDKHAVFKLSMALATLGAFNGGHYGAAAMLPLAYVGGSKGMAWALSDKKYGKAWHNALKSKNWEQAGFWLGRLAAASLAEGGRTTVDEITADAMSAH